MSDFRVDWDKIGETLNVHINKKEDDYEKGRVLLDDVEELVISSVSGDLDILGSDEGNSLEWEAKWRTKGNVETVREGKKLILRFDDKETYVNFLGIKIGGMSGNLEKARIFVPNHLKVISLNSVSGNLRVRKCRVEETFRCDTTSGDAFLTGCKAQEMKGSSKSGDFKMEGSQIQILDLSTISGDIRCEEYDGTKARFRTKSGDITFEAVPHSQMQKLWIEEISGDARVNNAPANLKFTGVSSDAVISTEYTRGIDWQLTTVSGDIRTHFPETHFLLLFQTVSGEYYFHKTKALSLQKGKFQLGDGNGGEVRVKTVSGDVSVKSKLTVSASETQEKVPTEEKERIMAPDENVQKILDTFGRGIITEEEAREMIAILGFTQKETDFFFEQSTQESFDAGETTEEDNDAAVSEETEEEPGAPEKTPPEVESP
ncbi:MAG TPA: DUF4097 family beta strand repeat-containing protein [Thermotogota bacterium]|nr:DUF4097 family beta strand repeat-containing protein [Thermotogota bacterium]HRW92148.1 DUF4097 family beta strand repeat-containing protein [Thermotogota bacterium]